MANQIELQVDSGIARLTINRPPLNILNLEAIMEMDATLQQIAQNEQIGILLMQGAGDRAFSAGVDVNDHSADRIGQMLDFFHSAFHRLLRMDQVTVAVIRGHCLGGGCELAIACDMAIATLDARLGQPEIDLGCFAPVAAAMLPATVGWKRAAEILFLGRVLSGEEACRYGLINRAVSSAELNPAVDQLVSDLKSKSRVVLGLCKQAMRTGLGIDRHAALKRSEHIYLRQLTRTEDMQEGIRAFIEKRTPVWEHR